MTFTVYVDGAEMGSTVSAKLRELCTTYEIEPRIDVVDVAADPQAAEEHNVVGVPTIVREQPRPRHRVIGLLDDERRVAQALALDVREESGGNA